MPEQQNQAMLMSGNSGNDQQNKPDMNKYVTKQDLEEIRKEIRNALNASGNQNGSNSSGQQNMNRGGNRNGQSAV